MTIPSLPSLLLRRVCFLWSKTNHLSRCISGYIGREALSIPLDLQGEETLSTLNYAARAKTIRLNASLGFVVASFLNHRRWTTFSIKQRREDREIEQQPGGCMFDPLFCFFLGGWVFFSAKCLGGKDRKKNLFGWMFVHGFYEIAYQKFLTLTHMSPKNGWIKTPTST